ncbi:MAG: hypothetical protein AAGC63_00090 [Propionicimonas sp.]|nr:hypothetical protein [Propionicimonas sp.]
MRSHRRAAPAPTGLPADVPGAFRTGPLASLAGQVEAGLVARLATRSGDVTLLDTDAAPGDWRRRVRPALQRLGPDARLVFNALSKDYLDLTEPGPAGRRGRAALGVAELARFATAAQTTVEAVVPYGALLGHPFGGRSLLAPLDRTHRWRRGVSWLARDDGRADLAAFLEQRVVQALPPGVAPYVMVVLARHADPAGNAGFAERHRLALSGSGAADLVELVRAQVGPAGSLEGDLDRLLTPLKARVFAFELLDQLSSRWPAFDPDGLLTPARSGEFARWRRAKAADGEATRLAREWSDGCRERVLHATDLTLSLDYGLVRAILEQYYDLYEERLG